MKVDWVKIVKHRMNSNHRELDHTFIFQTIELNLNPFKFQWWYWKKEFSTNIKCQVRKDHKFDSLIKWINSEISKQKITVKKCVICFVS